MLIPRSGEDFIDRPLNVLLLGQAIKQYPEFSELPVFTSLLWSRKISPLVASSHIWSYAVRITALIWNYISSFYQRLNHTFGNVRNNFLKQAVQKIPNSISRVKLEFKSRTSIRCNPVYPQVILVCSVTVPIFKGNYTLSLFIRHPA